jgi:hypothetical protein
MNKKFVSNQENIFFWLDAHFPGADGDFSITTVILPIRQVSFEKLN